MTFMVTATQTAKSNAELARDHVSIHDTEKEAKDHAEAILIKGFKDVAVWKQLATPRLQQTISWEEENV